MKPAPRLSDLIIKARRKLGLRQHELAKATGLSREQISHFECGRRLPTSKQRRTLSRVLGIPRSKLELACASMSNPGLLALRRKFGDDQRATIRRDRPSRIRYFKARKTFPIRMAVLEQRLKRRRDWQAIACYLREIWVDSDLEYLTHLQILDAGATTDWVAPQKVGLDHLPVVDPITRKINGHQCYPSLGLDGMILIPQLSLLTGIGVVRLDFAWGRRVQGSNQWSVLELDGSGHDSSSNQERRQATKLEVLRFDREAILAGNLVSTLLRKTAEPLFLALEPATVFGTGNGVFNGLPINHHGSF